MYEKIKNIEDAQIEIHMRKLKLIYEVFMENVYFKLDLKVAGEKNKFYSTQAKYLGLFEVVRKDQL